MINCHTNKKHVAVMSGRGQETKDMQNKIKAQLITLRLIK